MRASLLAALAATTLAAAPASAQQVERPVRFGVLVGGNVPTGDFSDGGAETGWHVTGLVEFRPAAFPVGLRGEIGYLSFGVDEEQALGEPVDGVDASANVIPFTVNAVLPLSPGSAANFYLIGGLGGYRLEAEADAGEFTISDSQTDFGLNGGVGLALPLGRADLLLEARYHSIFTEDSNTNFIPISIGLRF